MFVIQKQSPNPENALHNETIQKTSDQKIVNGEASSSQPKINADYAKVLHENTLLRKAVSEQRLQIEDLTTR
jgi:hypothetical protein